MFGVSLYVAMPALALAILELGAAGLILWAIGVGLGDRHRRLFRGPRDRRAQARPAISPNKTWAGLVGGMVAALVLVGWLVASWFGAWRCPCRCPSAAVHARLIAQVGDLFESWLKRRAGRQG